MTTPYQLLPSLTEEEYQALKADIKERGIMVPIEYDENGVVLDGHHRLRAWTELVAEGVGLPHYPSQTRAGMSEQQKRNHVRALNILRRHLGKDQLRDQWAAMRADGMTYQAIADASGVDLDTVRDSTFGNPKVQPPRVTGKDGKSRPSTYKPPQKKTKPPEAPVASYYTDSAAGEQKAQVKAQKATETGTEGASQPMQTTVFSHESEEYYTPPQYVEAAREVMGGIDLDPASCEKAQEWIRADMYFTVADDGYARGWHGRVWLNPPYSLEEGQSNQERWSQKLIREYQARRVTEGILLVKAALGYNWFEDLWCDWPVCCARKRISFIRPGGEDGGQSKMASAFLYFGPNVERFREVFSQFGRVIMPEA